MPTFAPDAGPATSPLGRCSATMASSFRYRARRWRYRLLIDKRQDAGRPAVRPAHLQRGDDDATASRQLGQARQILNDDLAGAQPHPVQLEVRAVDRIRGRAV